MKMKNQTNNPGCPLTPPASSSHRRLGVPFVCPHSPVNPHLRNQLSAIGHSHFSQPSSTY